MVRKRSAVWGLFKEVDSKSVQCLLCSGFLLRHKEGTTTNMLRHLRVKHPIAFKGNKGRVAKTVSTNGHQDMETKELQLYPAEVVVEVGESDAFTMGNEDDLNSVNNGNLEAAQGGPSEQITHEEASDKPPVKRRQSLIWRHFEFLDGFSAARCRICFRKLRCFESCSTSNLHRHMSTRHPQLFKKQLADGQTAPSSRSSRGSIVNFNTVTPADTVEAREKRPVPDDAMNGIVEAAQGGPAEQKTHKEASGDHSARRRLILRHFELLDSLAAARCRICSKKLHYRRGNSTKNMFRHMSKRHPQLFTQLVAKGSNVNEDTSTPPETAGATEERQIPGASKVHEGEKHLFRMEQQLIESLRRAQREEAQALEHQREQLEKLRAVNAREAAAEREQIESLRKAQQEEAKDLSRQKEELQKEKAKVQEKWKELQQEREKLALFSRGEQAS